MRHGVYDFVVRRKIKAGALTAERVNGKWYIESEQVHSQVHSQNGQGGEMSELVEHLTAKVEYLRAQLDKQTSLLAATTKQNADLIETPPPPRQSLIARLVFIVKPIITDTPSTSALT